MNELGLKAAAVVTAATLGLAGCAEPEPAGPRTAGPAKSPAARPPTRPLLVVTNAALGASRRHVRRAVADLKSAGLWRELTARLYGVKVSTRPGRASVPDDLHLADAQLVPVIGANGGGVVCDVVLFPTALADDLRRQRLYHRQGRLRRPPTSARAFWASLLGHELAHCRSGDELAPEPAALRWERKVLRALRAAAGRSR